jgi:outer membrane protein OmpA-like peptidoglycan-associated protein
MGGLDIFSSTGSKGQWKKAENLKYPVNSAGDDFAFISTEVTGNAMAGYLSSNRIGGIGGDDIYSFNYTKPKIVLVLKGVTYNKDTKEILPETSVTVFNGGREIVGKQSTKGDGVFVFELDEDSDYKVLGQKPSYYSDSAVVSTKGITKSDTLFAALYLAPLFEVGKTFVLENIHYDFDKSDIRKDAAEILDELVRIMRDNPTLKIELSSHTDSRGSDSYNEALSQRRAQSAVDYLVNRGIARDRMVAQGYGERRLLNRCSNGVSCSIAEHQENRRTEVEVLTF